MRSKDVDEAIKEGKDYIEFMTTAGDNAEWAETVLSYIEQLEKDNIELRKYYATRKEVEDLKDTINCLHESSKEYINKDKIRDKIKELKNELKSIQDKLSKNMLFSESEFYSFSEYTKWRVETNKKIKDINAKIRVLKSIIGE